MAKRRTIAEAARGSSAFGGGGGRLTGLGAIVRAGEWWEYKLVPILVLFYATALRLDLPIASLWPAAALLLAALVPGAIYVSLVNDAADRAEDLAAGKANRLQGRAPATVAAVLAVPVAVGLLVAWLWRDDPLLLGFYLAAWAAFSLYSLPPARLKVRGLAGVLADAAGAHLFPTLVAVVLVLRAAGAPVDWPWLLTAGAWALAYGLRGILWHQLLDAEADRTAGVRTFVQRHRRDTVSALGRYLLFPAELLALAALIWQLGHPAPLVALLIYAMLVWRRLQAWRMAAVIIEPRPRYLILLHEYYDVFLPLALLVASAVRHPIDLLAVAAHLILFPVRASGTVRDAWKLRPFQNR